MVGIGQRWGAGSGVVLGAGRVLTNAHNVRGSQVTVTFADGRTAEGNVAGHDIDGDLAVIETDTGQVPALPWATASPAIGMAVFALANPGGRGRGRRSGPSPASTGASAVPAACASPAAWGTPPRCCPAPRAALSWMRGTTARDQHEPPRRGLLPSHPRRRTLRRRVDALARGESVRPPQLGVTITPGHVARRLRRAVGLPDTDGLLIREVAGDSPAARADLAPGDLIVAAAGQPVRTIDDLSGALRAAAGTIELNILRGTDERSIQVPLGQDTQPEGEA